jgi:16S rRNA G966 N2-methylase RsmD
MTKEKLFTPEEAGVAYRFEPCLPLLGDWEGVKISNYQLAGEHTAERIKKVVGEIPVLEVCTGIGATTFVLARSFPKVYAVDLDPKRLGMCARNIERLGLSNKVELINGDILDDKILQRLTNQGIGAVYTDVNFTTSEDWQNHTSDIMETGPNTQELYAKVFQLITGNICMKLPKTINLDQLRTLGPCEIEEIKPDGKLSFYLVYFGELVTAEQNEYIFPKNFYSEQSSNQ